MGKLQACIPYIEWIHLNEEAWHIVVYLIVFDIASELVYWLP
jgi:hypothetical protein